MTVIGSDSSPEAPDDTPAPVPDFADVRPLDPGEFRTLEELLGRDEIERLINLRRELNELST